MTLSLSVSVCLFRFVSGFVDDDSASGAMALAAMVVQTRAPPPPGALAAARRQRTSVTSSSSRRRMDAPADGRNRPGKMDRNRQVDVPCLRNFPRLCIHNIHFCVCVWVWRSGCIASERIVRREQMRLFCACAVCIRRNSDDAKHELQNGIVQSRSGWPYAEGGIEEPAAIHFEMHVFCVCSGISASEPA